MQEFTIKVYRSELFNNRWCAEVSQIPYMGVGLNPKKAVHELIKLIESSQDDNDLTDIEKSYCKYFVE